MTRSGPYEGPVYPAGFLTYGVSAGKIELASCQGESIQTFCKTPGKVLDAPVAWWTSDNVLQYLSLYYKKSHVTRVEKSGYYYFNI